MERALKYLIIAIAAGICCVPKVFAADMDNGTDSNGKFIVSQVLSQRCGLSSKQPDITEDCYKRLAYDYKTDEPTGYSNFGAERKAIINDYVSAYIDDAVKQMTAAGKYEDRIDELIGKDPSAAPSLDNDAREEIEFNNKLASDNSSLMLDTIDLRASALNMDSLVNMLDVLVPFTDVDTTGKSLALPPS